ncbi:MAG TPA: hypothetical protein VFM36_16210 [Thermoanaerobaculia bacterium]|nr:hypothetical protein [Thermoanaerobaculia bacterium]
MIPIRVVLALLLTLMTAAGVFAQEFGRVDGGQIKVLTKAPKKMSGSLGISRSSQAANGYEATLGGEILDDRIWFFAAASILPEVQVSSRVGTVDAKLDAQLGSRSTLGASFSQQETQAIGAMPAVVPSSFLSLRYTGVISENIFFNASATRTTISNIIARPDPR